jgi:hypothetical protein
MHIRAAGTGKSWRIAAFESNPPDMILQWLNPSIKALVSLCLVLLFVGNTAVDASDTPLTLAQSSADVKAESQIEPKPAGDPPASGLKYPAGRWYFQTSAYTRHFNPSPDHVNHQRMLDFEYWAPDNFVWGATFLRNSFGQPTQYLYVGRLWRPFDSAQLIHVKLTGGILHGYKGQYRDKIPFNHYGYAPAIVPAIGVSGKWFGAEFVLLGAAAMMITVGAFWD